MARWLTLLLLMVVPSWLLHAPAAAGQEPSAGVRDTLTRFMDARIDRQDWVWRALMTDEALSAAGTSPVPVPTGQVSNPCWYRYELLVLAQAGLNAAAARVRIYEHQWPGDVGGYLPHSWEQGIRLAQTPDGWRVTGMGPEERRRAEPDEPHGPNTSACNVGRRPGVWLTTRSRRPATGRHDSADSTVRPAGRADCAR